ncbi:MAG: NADH-quinone oxidoreductase subunit N [Polyangiales bacterium]
MTAFLPFAPIVLLVVGGLAIMVLDAFAKDRAELALVTAVTLLVALAVSATALVSGASDTELPETVVRYLAADRLGLFMDVVICGGSALSALLAGAYLREHALERGEFYLLILFSALGAVVLGRAVDLLTVFVGIETLSLGVYALVAYRRTSARAAEGAMKYYLLGSFASAMLLFGSALVYGATGHTDFAGIGASVAGGEADATLSVVGLVFLVSGMAFKVSAVPFHMWTPDAYEGAVSPASTFMAVVVKSAAFALMIRLLVGAFGDEPSMDPRAGWPALIAGLAVLTMVVGNLSAVVQSSVKRMLAYSSIAHAGYAMLGLAAAHHGGGTAAVSAVLLYLLAYTVSNVLAFGGLVFLGSYGIEAVSYDDLAGVGRRHPLASLPLALGVLSLLGFPPTAGFFAKYYVFQAAVAAGGGYVVLALVGVLTSAVAAYYYLRVLVAMYMRNAEPGAPEAVPMRSGYAAAALILAGYFVLRIGFAPTSYLEMARDAAVQLLG